MIDGESGRKKARNRRCGLRRDLKIAENQKKRGGTTTTGRGC